MWINIEAADGTKYGDGPITTATSWVSRPRLDKPGKFSFRCSVGERQAAEIVAKRRVHCFDIVNGAVTELGVGGVIDQIETIIAGPGAPFLLVSGDDLLRDLRRHTVGDLELYDEAAAFSNPNEAWYYGAGNENDISMDAALDGNEGTHYEDKIYLHKSGAEILGDFLYFGHETKFKTIRLILAGQVNDNSSTLYGQYFSASGGWAAPDNFADGTASGGDTFAQTGNITYDQPDDWVPCTHAGVEAYWFRVYFDDGSSTELDTVDFSEIYIYEQTGSTTPIADIMAYAPAGWSVEDEAEAADPEPASLPKLKFGGESVLSALQKLAEDTGEHFRLGSGKTLVWIQSTVVSDIRAIGAHGADSVSLDGNAAICLIESLRVTEDHYEVATRVYPYGAGRGIGRVTLVNATDTFAGYTVDTAHNYIKVDTESAGTREERVLRFPEIGTEYDDAVQSEQASNDLATASYEWLSRHIAAQNAYRVSVLKLDGAVEPGATLDVFYQEYRDGTKVVDIDATLHVLEATHEVNGEGVRTTALYLGSIDTWPQSGGSVVAGLSHRVARLEAGSDALSATRVIELVETLEIEDTQFVTLTTSESLTNERVLTPGDGLAGMDGGAGSTYTVDVDVSDFAGAGLEDDGSENLRIAAAAAGDGLQGGAGSALAVDVSDFAGTGLEDDGTENLRIAAAAAGDGLQGGAGSALAVDVSDFAGTNLEDDGSENLRIAASAAGAGLTGGGAAVLAVGAGTAITVNANDVAVNLGYAFTWTAKHIFRSTTTPQVEIGYDAAAYMSISQADGGDVTLATVSDGNGNMIAAPAGDWIFDPVGNDVLPQTNYDINLGAYNKKFLSLHVANLIAETLVAQEVIATIGGHVWVGPTTELTADISDTLTVPYFKHNEMDRLDTLLVMSAPGGVAQVEFLLVDRHGDIAVANAAGDYFELVGDGASTYPPGRTFTIRGSTGNDGEWTVDVAVFNDPNTRITVDEDVTSDVADGYIAYLDSGPYMYRVIRSRDPGAASAWPAGTAVANTGNAGDGHIDIYSVHGIKSADEYGPTIVGNVRNSTTYNDWTPHWAIGELNGVYGYGATTYGAAFGKYADDWITIENTNGIRIYANNILVGQWQTNADLILGQVATDKANLFWDQSEGRLNFRGGTDGTAVMAYVDTDGSIYAAEGELVLNDDGIATVATTTLAPSRQYKIVESVGGNVIAYFGARQTPNGTNLQHAEIKVYAKADYASRLHLEVLSPSSDLGEIRLHCDSGGLDAYLWIRSTFGASREMILELDKITLTLDTITDLATNALPFDDAYADDWHNVADFYSMDRRRRDEDGQIVLIDDLAILRGILASGMFDERTGLELINDSTLPEWLLTRAKESVEGKRAILRNSQGKPYLSMKMVLSLLMGVGRQNDERISILEGA